MRKIYFVTVLAIAALVLMVWKPTWISKASSEETTEEQMQSVASVAVGKLLPVMQGDAKQQLIGHVGYTTSFNSDTRLPNWVYWELTYEKAHGSYPRDDDFRPDPKVKGKQADVSDYRGSGWDRGHMAPAGDMKWSETAMSESCYFSNICPQHSGLNGGDWRVLEEKCRSLTSVYDTLLIACGPIVGNAVNGTIGSNKVTVPDAFFKVLLGVKKGRLYGIGFFFSNTSGANKALRDYACTINDVERTTGIDFYSSLSDDIEETVESQCWLSDWNIK